MLKLVIADEMPSYFHTKGHTYVQTAGNVMLVLYKTTIRQSAEDTTESGALMSNYCGTIHHFDTLDMFERMKCMP